MSLKLTDFFVPGTYFGTKAEYDALGFERRLAGNATVNVNQVNGWLANVANWAENEALQLIGGIVSQRITIYFVLAIRSNTD